MGVKNSKNTITAQPFFASLLKGIALIILIFTSTENIYGKTSIIGFDLVPESVPNIVCLLATKEEKEPILFYLIVSKNLSFRYKKNILEIKLFSREIGYRASYNYNIEENEIDKRNLVVKDFNLQNLTLTHDHVYDLLSISYGKNYEIKGSMYYRVNVGLSINFPGEFYHTHMYLHPINLKEIRRYFLCFNSNDKCARKKYIVYNQFFHKDFSIPDYHPVFRDYYDLVFKSTSSYQWAVNILIGLIENIFVEYSLIVPICHFLILYPVHIHISIGTILGTIEWLYRYFKEEDKRGFLGYFYFIFFLNSISVFKIGYYE